ncbi:hypothetical protein BP6252_05510 [Coleophoma cylindrospora]|uniref:Uncharacterized protein n=1 Tax=Coleophoma cylindrospora TaxID=1849047 RepID=A0A3D8RTN8_9HELO|nr:hypothetical protein BP6252_05510 [Coleophoma cylindrospora]
MAFLFKSKKNADRSQSARDVPNGVAGSASSLQSANGRNKEAEKVAAQEQRGTPSSSVNNSITSLNGTGMNSSPEQSNGRRVPNSEPAQDLPLRNAGVPPGLQSPPANPNASLYPWSQQRLTYTTSHPSPFPRYGAAVNAVASKEGDIYLMGGLINSSTVKGDLWMVEAGGNMACYPLATTAEGPGPRVGHASLLVGNAFIVYGGDTKLEDTDLLDETLYLLNTSTRQWSRAVPAGPRPAGRYGHSLNILGSKIYVFGGQVEGYFMNDLVAFDLNQLQVPTNRWEFLIRNSDEGGPPVGQVPPARTNHSMVTYNEKLYLFGGTNGFQWFNDVWCYDPIPNAWVSLDCIGYIPAPREGHAAAIVDDVMYIFGGRTEEGADLGDLAAFRISSRRWYTFQNMGPSPSPRSGHSMTAFGKQVVVLAGEPSTATREAQDLSIVYLLDTSKIRYPNDQQIQSTPAGERVPGRRPSGGDKSGMGASRGLTSRDGSVGPEARRPTGTPRESVTSPQGGFGRSNGIPNVNGNDANGMAPGSAQPQGAPAGSRLPRASMAQAPLGPPPQQQPPPPRMNGAASVTNGKGKPEKGHGPAIDTSVRNPSLDGVKTQTAVLSPSPRDSPQAKESPVTNGRRTPTQQQPGPKPLARVNSDDPPQLATSSVPVRSESKTRQGRQQNSLDSISESTLRNVTNRQPSPPPAARTVANPPVNRRGSARNSQTVNLLKELDAAKNKNAWYASELELARKAGYVPTHSSSPTLEQRATESFDDEDKPLIEALLAMKAELTNIQGSIDKQAIIASKKIAEVEKQRDAAVSEAVYAKAKLAAHAGSQSSTPQPDSDARDLGMMSADRSNDIGRKLAAALAEQKNLNNKLELMTAEVEAEKRGRKLAEEIANTAQTRLSQLEAYQQQNSAEVERLKAELHECQTRAREEGIVCAEALAAAQLVKAEKEELSQKHQEVLGNSKDSSDTFDSLREAIAASADMKSLLERKLDEERDLREKIESKLNVLKGEHEARTTELETAQRRLKDAEELAEQYATEARTHREAVMAGLDKVVARDAGPRASLNEDRIIALTGQAQAANALARKYQAAADAASEKLRSAEERIAGLEAYQEQASRDGMSIRKQLQAAMRETQSLQAANSEMKYQLANQQLETNAVHVQHNTLKDILGERGISPAGAARVRGLGSPQSGSNTPDIVRHRELEQQLAASMAAHQEMRETYESREQQAESAYREKLGQLENDYQSAVHYVKGTEKMLKRMKDELSKYKAENARMKDQLVEADEKNASRDVPSDWEDERTKLNKQIETLQADLSKSAAHLESQLAQIKTELQTAQKERDQLKQSHEDTQRELSASAQEAKANLAQLQEENALLERRAKDAEQKVSLLLDQVEQSVDTYRRQSRQAESMNGHQRNASGQESLSDSSLYEAADGSNNRNSMALDSLATELESLRSHWETTNKNYRTSNAFDFDDRPSTKGDADDKGPELSGSLADWRKRLDAEERNSKEGVSD